MPALAVVDINGRRNDPPPAPENPALQKHLPLKRAMGQAHAEGAQELHPRAVMAWL